MSISVSNLLLTLNQFLKKNVYNKKLGSFIAAKLSKPTSMFSLEKLSILLSSLERSTRMVRQRLTKWGAIVITKDHLQAKTFGFSSCTVGNLLYCLQHLKTQMESQSTVFKPQQRLTENKMAHYPIPFTLEVKQVFTTNYKTAEILSCLEWPFCSVAGGESITYKAFTQEIHR